MRLVPHRLARTLLRTTASAACVALGFAATLHAQPAVQPFGPPMDGPPRVLAAPGGLVPNRIGPDGASRGAAFLLAHTGELQLTDAQVVRLAAVARRVEARRRAFRARVDSARSAAFGADPRPAPGDSARRRPAPGGPRPGLVALRDAEQRREQERADLRDALSVLSPDQQATAWLLVSAPAPRGAGALGGPGGVPRGGPAR